MDFLQGVFSFNETNAIIYVFHKKYYEKDVGDPSSIDDYNSLYYIKVGANLNLMSRFYGVVSRFYGVEPHAETVNSCVGLYIIGDHTR